MNGTIEGGCWQLYAGGCDPDPPQSRWTVYHVKEGPEMCDPMVLFHGEVEMNPLPGAFVEGTKWAFDDTRPVGKFDHVVGGFWQVHQTARKVFGEQTYVLHVGTFNPGDPSLGDVTMTMDNSDMILSGPGSSSIASLSFTPNHRAGCGHALLVSLDTADDTTYTPDLTFATLEMTGDRLARPHINRDSLLGATSTNVLITQSATLINGDIRAKSLTVDNPAGGSSVLNVQSPRSDIMIPPYSNIILAGPITFAGTPDGKSELVYSNRDNLIATQGQIVGDVAVDGFTLHTKARINADSGTPELQLELAGSFDIRTDFMAFWGETARVGRDWDSRATDLTMTVMDPCSAKGTIELFSQDVGPIVFTDTPCMGALQDLILRAPGEGEDCTTVDLVDNYLNRPPSGDPETLYVRNIVIEANRTLEVGVPYYIHYYGQRIVGGVVASGGVPLTGGPGDARDDPFIAACDTIFGDFDCDGEISRADIDAFCAIYNGSEPYDELFDANCDGDLDCDDLCHLRSNAPGATCVGASCMCSGT